MLSEATAISMTGVLHTFVLSGVAMYTSAPALGGQLAVGAITECLSFLSTPGTMFIQPRLQALRHLTPPLGTTCTAMFQPTCHKRLAIAGLAKHGCPVAQVILLLSPLQVLHGGEPSQPGVVAAKIQAEASCCCQWQASARLQGLSLLFWRSSKPVCRTPLCSTEGCQ